MSLLGVDRDPVNGVSLPLGCLAANEIPLGCLQGDVFSFARLAQRNHDEGVMLVWVVQIVRVAPRPRNRFCGGGSLPGISLC